MKHYVLEVVTTSEGTTKTVTEENNRPNALVKFYQSIASIMSNEQVLVGFCTVIDATGKQLPEATQFYAKPQGNVYIEE